MNREFGRIINELYVVRGGIKATDEFSLVKTGHLSTLMRSQSGSRHLSEEITFLTYMYTVFGTPTLPS